MVCFSSQTEASQFLLSSTVPQVQPSQTIINYPHWTGVWLVAASELWLALVLVAFPLLASSDETCSARSWRLIRFVALDIIRVHV